MPERVANAETASREHLSIVSLRDNPVFEARLILGGEALDPSNTDLPEISEADLQKPLDFTPVVTASNNERTIWWQQQVERDYPSQKKRWVNEMVTAFAEKKVTSQTADWQRWGTFFQKIGVANFDNFKPEDAEAFYNEYFGTDGRNSEIEKFNSSIIEGYTDPASRSVDLVAIARDIDAAEWIGGTFGRFSSLVTTQTLLTQAKMKDPGYCALLAEQMKEEKEILVDGKLTKKQRINRLNEEEKLLLTIVALEGIVFRPEEEKKTRESSPIGAIPPAPTPAPQDAAPVVDATPNPPSVATQEPDQNKRRVAVAPKLYGVTTDNKRILLGENVSVDQDTGFYFLGNAVPGWANGVDMNRIQKLENENGEALFDRSNLPKTHTTTTEPPQTNPVTTAGKPVDTVPADERLWEDQPIVHVKPPNSTARTVEPYIQTKAEQAPPAETTSEAVAMSSKKRVEILEIGSVEDLKNKVNNARINGDDGLTMSPSLLAKFLETLPLSAGGRLKDMKVNIRNGSVYVEGIIDALKGASSFRVALGVTQERKLKLLSEPEIDYALQHRLKKRNIEKKLKNLNDEVTDLFNKHAPQDWEVAGFAITGEKMNEKIAVDFQKKLTWQS